MITSMERKLQSPSTIRYFIIICWIAYYSTYLGRLNYSAAMNEMVKVGFLTKPEAGMIGTGFFFCYGFGQLLSGFLGDRIPSKWMCFVGVSGSAFLNLMMAFSNHSAIMLLLWCANGFAQSLTWAPIIKILSDRLTKERCRKASVVMSTTTAIGTLSAYLLAALMIGMANWRGVFLASSIIIGFISVFWLITIGQIEASAETYETPEPVSEAPNRSENQVKCINLWKLFVGMGMLPVILCIILQGILKDGVMTWVPTYISEIYHLGSVTSILATTLLPVINLGGVYAAYYFNSRFSRNEVITSGICFAVAAISLAVLILFGKYHVIIAVLALAFTTSAMMGVNTMFISLIPLYFSRIGKVSTVTGILNSSAYLGSALSSYGIGLLAQLFNWNITIITWFALAITGAILCITVKNIFHYGRKSLEN